MNKKLSKVDVKFSKSNPPRLAQAINSGLEFTFASENDEQCGPFAFCKDYLQDAIYGLVNNKEASIYGYSYSPEDKQQPSIKKIKILLTNSSDVLLKNKIPGCIDFLNQIEDKLKIKKSVFKECIDPPDKYKSCGVWEVVGSKRWLRSPVMISLYTLLIRVGFSHKKGNYDDTISKITNNKMRTYQPVDKSRLISAMPGINRIFEEGDRNIFKSPIKSNFPDSVGVGIVHGTLGIVGFSQESAKPYVPKWYKTKNKNKLGDLK